VNALRGDPAKAEAKLGWKATVGALELARLMVDADIAALEHAGSPWIDRVQLSGWPVR
jgi:GDPmannose 4,6-dehydratase